MPRKLLAGLEDLRQSLRDPSRPMPPWVWFGLAGLVSFAFFLWLRLAAVRMAPPERAAIATPAPALAPGAQGAPSAAPRPDASRAAIGAVIEGWRRSAESRDLSAWMKFYARSFGARGMDLAALAERSAHDFSAPAAPSIAISSLDVQAGSEVVIATFLETRTQTAREERTQVRLYFLAEGGAWRIFNEERAPQEPGSERP